MFYYIQDNKIIATSETKLKINDTVEEVEIEEVIENAILEEGKIIPYVESLEYKKILEEENKEVIEDNILDQEIEKFKNIWYDYEIIDGKVVKLDTEKNKQIDFNIWLSIINSEFLRDLEAFTSKYTLEEMQTWDLKVREAEKVIAGGESTILDTLQIPGRTTLDLSKMILENSANYFRIYTEAEKKKTLALQELKKQFI